jgi:hypothetical protein
LITLRASLCSRLLRRLALWVKPPPLDFEQFARAIFIFAKNSEDGQGYWPERMNL